MSLIQSETWENKPKDYLWLHLRDLPYFRALLRAVESRFYQGINLPSPLLDLGCGDGHFAKITFDAPPEVGIDSGWKELSEANDLNIYTSLIMGNAAEIPFPDGYFRSVVSNSVLEHIPQVDEVLKEISRILKPGSPFVFCVPNHNFLRSLSIGRILDNVGLEQLGNKYRVAFNLISRHHHCDSPITWETRLYSAGFNIEKWWHYFSPGALRTLEWGHYFGLPSWIIKKFTGRWIVAPIQQNLYFTRKLVQRYYDEPYEQQNGVYTFFITRRL